ncbi:uncharacterized protein DNG_02547 [Cephalotrichum gorgonifer]|uniref:Zn(2)-C6 fungal-type domain-containing protein n=1 Tax=Cephalotrichum gorgonifer TaxID=2041049 RepID=A0AAE8ST65_9PEZI|nr:uncharacterized protein DNG_02547 [Cephalotrichum gorgonifer]
MARPVCGQCVRVGLVCEGYDRQTIFLHATSGQSRRYRREDKPVPAASTAAPDTLVSTGNNGSSDGGGATILLPDALFRAAHEERYLSAFLEKYFPESREFPSKVTPYINGGWTVALPQLFQASPRIRRILLAVCLASAGDAPERAWERKQGLTYYTQSLQDMSATLSGWDRDRGRDQGTAGHTAVLVTSRLSSLYETLCGHDSQDPMAQARNWRHHLIGELAIIMSYPPETYTSGYMHQLFVDGRLHLISSALQMRKRSELNRPEWKTIPWRDISKTPKDLLVDILLDTPGLLEDLDVLKASPYGEVRDALRREIIRNCWACDEQLSAWRAAVGIRDPAYAFEIPESPTFSIDLLAAAHIMTIYWTTSVIVYSTLRTLCPSPASPHPPHTDPGLYCRRIAETIPILLHPDSGVYGAQMANLPAAIVLVYENAIDGGGAAGAIIFDAYRRAGRHEAAQRFQSSMRRQEARSPRLAMMEGPDADNARARSWLGMDEENM